jgi:hypothetical protein
VPSLSTRSLASVVTARGAILKPTDSMCNAVMMMLEAEVGPRTIVDEQTLTIIIMFFVMHLWCRQ